MENNRRQFLKIAGVAALGMGLGTGANVFAASEESKPKADYQPEKNALTAKHWGMVIDTRKLSEEINKEIQHACHKFHNVPEMQNENHEIKWIWSEEYKHVFPNNPNKYLMERLKELPILVMCNHCENPSCVRACPTKATFQRDDGIVLMDFHRCIGCRFCMAACPYGSRSFNYVDPRLFLKESVNPEFPTRMKGVVEKCNFCAERLAQGKPPACVEVSQGAMIFGDLEDPNSDIRKLLASNYTIRRKQELGTEPSVYYIV